MIIIKFVRRHCNSALVKTEYSGVGGSIRSPHPSYTSTVSWMPHPHVPVPGAQLDTRLVLMYELHAVNEILPLLLSVVLFMANSPGGRRESRAKIYI